ncbi:MAG: hypothetical protein IPF41_10030 [Flavobacteriales bacterium]|nr:hypothetical protein [Flavobacteriales bacterium]
MTELTDPQAALTYGAIGLGIAGLSAFGEQSQQVESAQQQRLRTFSESYSSNSRAFGFVERVLVYNTANLIIERRKNGRVQAVHRTNLYSITSSVADVRNSAGVLSFIEVVSYHNHGTGVDSCTAYLVEIPIGGTAVNLYNGNYTNRYSSSSSGWMNFRYKWLDNEVIGNVVGNGGQLSGIPSGLKDVLFDSGNPRIAVRILSFAGGSRFPREPASMVVPGTPSRTISCLSKRPI